MKRYLREHMHLHLIKLSILKDTLSILKSILYLLTYPYVLINLLLSLVLYIVTQSAMFIKGANKIMTVLKHSANVFLRLFYLQYQLLVISTFILFYFNTLPLLSTITRKTLAPSTYITRQ